MSFAHVEAEKNIKTVALQNKEASILHTVKNAIEYNNQHRGESKNE